MSSGVAEVTSIECGQDIAGSLAGKYFLIYDESGSVEVWFKIAFGSGSAPGVANRAIQVTVFTDDGATTVAECLRTELEADGAWSIAIRNSNVVTLTDAHDGQRTDAADVNTGFSISVTTQGA